MENLFKENRFVWNDPEASDAKPVDATALGTNQEFGQSTPDGSKQVEKQREGQDELSPDSRNKLLEEIRQRKDEFYSKLAEGYKDKTEDVTKSKPEEFQKTLYGKFLAVATVMDSGIWGGFDRFAKKAKDGGNDVSDPVWGELDKVALDVFSNSKNRNELLAEAFSQDVVAKLKDAGVFELPSNKSATFSFKYEKGELKVETKTADKKPETEAEKKAKEEKEVKETAKVDAVAKKLVTKGGWLISLLSWLNFIPSDPRKFASKEEFIQARKDAIVAGLNGEDAILGFVFGACGSQCEGAKSMYDSTMETVHGSSYAKMADEMLEKTKSWREKGGKALVDAEKEFTGSGVAVEPVQQKNILAGALAGTSEKTPVDKRIAFEESETIDESKDLQIRVPKDSAIKFPSDAKVVVREAVKDGSKTVQKDLRVDVKHEAITENRTLIIPAGTTIPAGTIFEKGIVFKYVPKLEEKEEEES